VKFVIPNGHGIALHGTPRSAVFTRSRRAFSHGCIRLEDPGALAAWVLRHDPGWDTARVQQVMTGDETVEVQLERPVPVLVFYGTASVTEDGEVRFFQDVYGRDRRLERSLARRREVEGRIAASDLGPPMSRPGASADGGGARKSAAPL
jgi:murein L,D-transpeptidase YcbB/YkuD